MKQKILKTSVLFLISLVLILGDSCQSPVSEAPQPGKSGIAVEYGGPFSCLRNEITDKALAHLYSTYPSLADSSRSVKTLPLEEKFHLLANGHAQGRSISSDTIDNDPYYGELTREMMSKVHGFITVSDHPLGLSIEATAGLDTPFIQEVNGVGYSKFEILEMAEKAAFGSPSSSRGLTRVATPKWGNVIEYRFESSVTPEVRGYIRTAMNNWQDAAPGRITFTEIEDNLWNELIWTLGFSQHLKITQGTNSNIGGCATLGAGSWKYFEIDEVQPEYIMGPCRHELGHVLGLEHEQCRYDRDKYVDVLWNNIMDYEWYNPSYYRSQYALMPLGQEQYLYIYINLIFFSITIQIDLGYWEISRVYESFDYDSVMIYHSWGFSKTNPATPTMLKKDGSYIWANTSLSQGDMASIRAMYK